MEDALVIEAADSPYVNILVVKEGSENNEAVYALRRGQMFSNQNAGTTAPL